MRVKAVRGEVEVDPEPTWYPLARVFKRCITEVESVMLYSTKPFGVSFEVAVIKTWELDPDYERSLQLRINVNAKNSHRVRDTITFKPDEIVCYNVVEGYFHIDLIPPSALETLFGWMKKCGLVKQESELPGD